MLAKSVIDLEKWWVVVWNLSQIFEILKIWFIIFCKMFLWQLCVCQKHLLWALSSPSRCIVGKVFFTSWFWYDSFWMWKFYVIQLDSNFIAIFPEEYIENATQPPESQIIAMHQRESNSRQYSAHREVSRAPEATDCLGVGSARLDPNGVVALPSYCHDG